MSKQLNLEGNYGVFWRIRRSKFLKGRTGEKAPNYGRTGEKASMYGKHHSEATKQKMSDSHWDCSGKNNPNYGKTGEKAPMYGRTGVDAPNYNKIGEKNQNWKGGISYEPYCIKFNKEFKDRVRDFFNGCCYVCGVGQSELSCKLDVHHVNYGKMVCCNDVKPLFVPLCQSCHAKTLGDREYWEEFFTVSLEYLTDGECFLPKKVDGLFIEEKKDEKL